MWRVRERSQSAREHVLPRLRLCREDIARTAQRARMMAEGSLLLGMKLSRALLSEGIRWLEQDLGTSARRAKTSRRIRIE